MLCSWSKVTSLFHVVVQSAYTRNLFDAANNHQVLHNLETSSKPSSILELIMTCEIINTTISGYRQKVKCEIINTTISGYRQKVKWSRPFYLVSLREYYNCLLVPTCITSKYIACRLHHVLTIWRTHQHQTTTQ